MRQTSDADAEAWVLTSEPGRVLLDEVAATSHYGPTELQRWRRNATPEQVAAAVRLTLARVRGKAKFSRAEAMWFEPVGLEQATAEPVARHKARRFRGAHLLDLCCGIGGDTLALAGEQAQVLAVDADQGMCRRTRWNAQVYEVADHVEVIRAQVERIRCPTSWLVHIDPDRRQGLASAQRARDLLDYSPGLGFLQALPGRVQGGAIKLSPASDFLSHFGEVDCELEVISLGGECKEATVWFGALASCRRRATRLPENVSWTDQDGPRHPFVPIASPLAWVFDPDPSLGRSGLLDSFAAANGLARCAPGIDFLTGPEPIDSPFLACFEVEEVLPLDLKTLGKVVNAKKLGPLEIKTKGTNLRPETLRSQWKPRGPHPATLLLMGGRGNSRAILARRKSPASSHSPRIP